MVSNIEEASGEYAGVGMAPRERETDAGWGCSFARVYAADSWLVPTNQTEGVGPIVPQYHTARQSDPAQIMESFPSVLKISDKGFDGGCDITS